MSEILKPCPFCGSNARIGRVMGRLGVLCNECNVIIRSDVITELNYDNVSEQWNTRKDPYTVDSTHTDPTEKETALALAERRLKRAVSLLHSCLPSIKCENSSQCNMITAIGEFLDKRLEDTLMPDKGGDK